jgi:HD domain
MTSSGLTQRFQNALTLAYQLHGDAIRKGSEQQPIPYVAHLLEVTAIVMSESVPEDVAIAALLHDGPEDAGGVPVLDLIRQAFGDRVAQIIAECTDTFEDPKPDWIQRKLTYLERLRRTNDWDVLLIKCADGLSNARATLYDYRTLGPSLWTRFKKMPCASNQRWWYASVRDAVSAMGRGTHAFLEFDAAVSQLIAETKECPGCKHQHLTMPTDINLPEEDDFEAYLVGGFDPASRCPVCHQVPLAPPDGSGRNCPNCGHQWTRRLRRQSRAEEVTA